MYYCVESDKSFYEAGVDLEAVILRQGFTIRQADDLGEWLRGKGAEGYDEDCQVFEVFHPDPLEALLIADARLAVALPLRLSVFTENGITRLAALRPSLFLPMLNTSTGHLAAVRDLENRLCSMIDEAR